MRNLEEELTDIKIRYQTSPYKDDQRVMNLDDFDFCALIYQLITCQFMITPFSNKNYITQMLIGMDLPCDVMDFVMIKKGRITIQNHLLL